MSPRGLQGREAEEVARALHRQAYVADAHADALLWNRDLRARQRRGHVDFVRLAEAGVRLQVFTVVSRGFPFIGGFQAFALARHWPLAAIWTPWRRTLFQVERLTEMCASGAAVLATTPGALAAAEREGKLACILGIEGGHAIEGRVERVEELARRGVAFLGLTHLVPNELGGSSFPLRGRRGLTPLGGQVLEALASHGLAVDVAHASRRLLDALLPQAQARIFCSHTGVAALGPRWRNLDDAVLRRIADRGGVVGIIFGTPYLGSRRLEAVADHIEHAVGVAGEEAVCLGSDFDGMVPLPTGMRDVTDLWKLTALLLKRGHPRSRIERILGLNLRRFLAEVLGDIERRRGSSAGRDDLGRSAEPGVDRALDSRPG
ncbi:MAG TPA: membrane dipeptidase [Myxococcaceae bacterium]|nr:membrane dipeptidase [Myxococcaceae bacterium]